MPNRTVKFWRKVDDRTVEPFANTKQELFMLIRIHDYLGWCRKCHAVVESETKLGAEGMYNVCVFCGTKLLY